MHYNSRDLNQTFCPQQQLTPEKRIDEYIKAQIETQQEKGGAPIRINDLISKVKNEMASNHRESSSLLIKVSDGSICEEQPRTVQPEPTMTEEQVIEKAFEQFYRTAASNASQHKTKSFDSRSGNDVTSRTDESHEVILSPNQLYQSTEKLNVVKHVTKETEQSLDQQLREEGLEHQIGQS